MLLYYIQRIVVLQVRHSQKANEPPLKVWVRTDHDGIVKCAHCQCMAGLGEVCSHVAAVLFYVDAAYRNKTCTEIPCQWVIPSSVDNIPYSRIADIDFTRPKPGILPVKRAAHCNNDCDMLSDPSDIECSSRPYHSTSSSVATINPNMTKPTTDHITTFFNAVSKHKPSCLSLQLPYSDSYIPQNEETVCSAVPSYRDLYSPQNEELTYSELINVCEETKPFLTREEILQIERETRDQYKSDVWFLQRAGRITASKMKSVCRTEPSSPSVSLVDQICYPEKHRVSTEAIRWGCDHEGIAREAYIQSMETQHTDFYCFCSGLIIDEEHNFLAATPDAVTQCECHGNGVLEIKCPFSTRDIDPEEAECLENGSLCKSHQYYYQIQTQLFVTGADFADFVVCTFPNCIPTLHVERIQIDDEFMVDCVEKATQFFSVAILPELLGKWFTRSLVIPPEIESSSDYNYCYCNEEKGGEMVCCDNNSCQYGQWFHIKCLNLKSAPKVKHWYCSDCRKQMKQSKSK